MGKLNIIKKLNFFATSHNWSNVGHAQGDQSGRPRANFPRKISKENIRKKQLFYKRSEQQLNVHRIPVKGSKSRERITCDFSIPQLIYLQISS